MNGYTRETGPAFYRQVRERIAALPGVEEASLASWLPLGLGGCKGAAVRVDGYERPAGEDTTYEFAIVSPRYFAAMRVPLLSGRDFTDGDDAKGAAVAIVNETFARRFWPGLDPLGRMFRANGRERTIVGVAKTGRYNRLNEDASCFFYLPYLQGVPDLDLGLCVRTSGDAGKFANSLRQAVREVDPAVSLLNVKPLMVHIGGSFFTQRMASQLLTMLGIVALVLAAMGVYAVMAYAVSQRTQEFGLRMALGASARDVLTHVVGQGLVLAALGTAVGLALSLAATRLLAGFLHGVSPFDPLIFLSVPLVLALVAALACWMPARRATRVNPIEALRSE